MKHQFKKNKNRFNSYIRYSNLAFEMMGIIILGTILGYKIDDWMGNEFRIFTLVFIVLSVTGSVVYAIRNFLKK